MFFILCSIQVQEFCCEIARASSLNSCRAAVRFCALPETFLGTSLIFLARRHLRREREELGKLPSVHQCVQKRIIITARPRATSLRMVTASRRRIYLCSDEYRRVNALKLLHGSPPFPSAPSTDPTERGLSSGVMLGAGAKKEGGNPPTLFFSPSQTCWPTFPGIFSTSVLIQPRLSPRPPSSAAHHVGHDV